MTLPRGSGQGFFLQFHDGGRVGSGQEVFKLSHFGPGWVGSPLPDPTRPDQTRPDPTRPDQTRPDPTREVIGNISKCFWLNQLNQCTPLQPVNQVSTVARSLPTTPTKSVFLFAFVR